MVELFASDATRAVIADWVELELHHKGARRISDVDVTGASRTLADPEQSSPEWDEGAGDDGEFLDREILDSDTESRRDDLYDELAHRQQMLGEFYPFLLTPRRGGGWQLERRQVMSREARAAHWAYLASLYMASFKHHHITKRSSFEDEYRELEAGISERFQALSVLAAANLLGHAYWFGWPRPNGLPFHAALQEVVDLIGHGELRDAPPTNRSHVKDGTVDLVAWKPFGDRLYGTLILYGQVASGNNWRDKPVYMFLRGNFLDHFKDHPSDHYLGATFIPFLLHTELKKPTDSNMSAAMMDDARQLEKNYGTVIDRLRLTQLMGEGGWVPERIHNVQSVCKIAFDVIRWVRACTRYCAI